MNTLRRDRNLNCFCGVLMLFVNMGILSTTFSCYFPYFRELKGLTNTQVLLLTTVRSIFALIAMANSERYFRFFDIRKGSVITFLVAALSFAVLAFSPDWRLYYLATALFGFSYGLGGMIPASILLRRWFHEHSGTAIGIAATGSGIAGMILPILITFLVEGWGLTAAFSAQAVMILALMLPILLFVKNHPDPSLGLEAAPDPAGSPASSSGITRPGKNPDGNVFHLRNHAPLIAGMLLMGVLGFGPASSFSMLLREGGREMTAISLQLSVFGFYLIPAKILIGEFADHFGGKRTLVIFGGLSCLSILLYCFSARLPDPALSAVFLMFALGVSLTSVGISIIAGDFSDDRSFPHILKICQFTYALGGLLFSVVPGMIADRFGTYVPAYALMSALSLLLILVLLPEYRRKKTA